MAQTTGFDPGEVATKLDYVKTLYGERDTWFEQADNIFKLDHSAAFKFGDVTSDDDLRHNISTPVRQVRHILGMLLGNPLVISVFPYKDTKAARAMAGEIERFLYGVLQDSERRFGAVLARAYANALVRGWASWFIGWDVEREGSKEDLGNPIVWKPVDPMYLYYEPGGVKERFQSVMYSFQRRRVDVEREWDTVLKPASENPHDASSDKVEYTDYWWYDHSGAEWEIWHAVLSGTQVLKDATKMTPYYDRLPYITWFCQPGPYTGPEDWGRGTLYDLREVIKTRERVVDRLLHRLALAADGVVNIVQAQPQADDIGDWQYEKVSGTINYVPRGWEPRTMPLEPVPPEAMAILQELNAEETQIGLSGPPMGVLPGGNVELPGVTFHGLSDAATQWLATDTDSLATTLQSAFELVMNLCVEYAQSSPVSVIARVPGSTSKKAVRASLSGKDMEGYYVDVSIDTATDADRVRRQTLGLQLLNLKPEDRPLAKREIAERYFDNQDYERTKRYQLDELVESLPVIQQALAKEAAQAEGLPINLLEQPSQPNPSPSPQMEQAAPPGAGLPPALNSPQGIAGSPPPMPTVPMPGAMPGGPMQGNVPVGVGMPPVMPPGTGM